MKGYTVKLLVCLSLFITVSGCSPTQEAQPSSTPAGESPHGSTPSATLEPTLRPTQEILFTPTLRHTPDTQLESYMQGAESQLHHGSILVFDTVASFAEACPGYYLAAFPYRTTRSVFSFVLFRLPRMSDGEVNREQQDYLWNWLTEGIFPHEYEYIKRLDVIEGWPLMLQWTARWPGGQWDTGLAYGECPGDDFAMIGLFRIQGPTDFMLRVSRYNDQAPFDFWLQEADQLTHYHYDRYEAIPLWSLEDTPGQLVSVQWDETSPDFNEDGQPDLVIVWSIDGQETQIGYIRQGDGFVESGPVDDS